MDNEEKVRVLIEIPRGCCNVVKRMSGLGVYQLAVANGTLISDMTNGEIMMLLFPNCRAEQFGHNDMSLIDNETNTIIFIAHKWWWNAKYGTPVDIAESTEEID